jgi:endoglucanase
MRHSLALLALTIAGCAAGNQEGTSSSPPSSAQSGAGGAAATSGSGASASTGAGGAGGGAPLPALPLHTSDRWILDANGKRFKLASVSWYGAEEQDYVPAGLERADRRDIAKLIRVMGFNSVRIPWSNEMFELNPVVADAVIAKNPDLAGGRALDVLDAVIAALAHEGLVVILDNHVSRADWCCNDTDGNGLWYTNGYPEASWLADWKAITARYQSQPAVVGAELRNELRAAQGKTPVWGGNDPALDWHAAAERGGNAVLGVNPDLLIVVQGMNYAADLAGPYTLPVKLAVDHRLVYAAHDYAWFHNNLSTYADLKTALGDAWGYLLVQNKPYTAPVWVSEFGTCHTDSTCVSAATGSGFWFVGFRQYLTEADIDWAYWALNGTQAKGTGRTFGAEDTYGVLDTSWSGPAMAELLDALKALEPATQGP